MKKFKTLIVEDNDIEMKYLVDLLSDHSDIIEIAGKAETYNDALLLLSNAEYHMSILDYQLDRSKTLFNLVEAVGRKKLGLIVYTSREKSLDIEKILDVKPDFRLYKPFDEISMSEFIVKLKIHAEEKLKAQNRYMVFYENGLKINVMYDDIYYIMGSQSGTSFVCRSHDDKAKTRVYLRTDGSIGTHSYLLETGVFIKCHKSYYVNTQLIKAVKKSEDEIYFDIDCEIGPAYYAVWFLEWLDENGY